MQVIRRMQARFRLNGNDITGMVRDVVVCTNPRDNRCYVTVTYTDAQTALQLLVPDSALTVEQLDGQSYSFNFDARATIAAPDVLRKFVTSSVFECPHQPPAVWRPMVCKDL